MFEKFERTFPSWFIVLFPTISVLVIIVDKIANFGLANTDDWMLFLLISFLVDNVAVAFIGALLKLYDVYGRKDRDKNV